jgi:hypothetical protein
MSDPTHTDSDPALTCRPEDIRYRVLLAVPEALNIPHFALGAEAKRSQIQTTLIASKDEESRLVGGNVFRGLGARYGEHRFISVRRRLLQKTALYSAWLAFADRAQAEAFVRDHPRFGLDGLEARTSAEQTALQHSLEHALAQGRFNLGHIDPNARLRRANEYVEACDRLDALEQGRWALSKLREDLMAYPEGVSVG